jgi:hypothetical protein
LGGVPALLNQQLILCSKIKPVIEYLEIERFDELYEQCLDSISLLLKFNNSLHLNIDVQFPFEYLNIDNVNAFKLKVIRMKEKIENMDLDNFDQTNFDEITKVQKITLKPLTMLILCYIDFCNNELSFEELEYIFNKWMN